MVWSAYESAETWTNTTVAYLPFLEWHEFQSLKDVGTTVLSMPFSPFFSLFVAKESAVVRAYNNRRGATRYVEEEWRADRMFEGRVRTVRYDTTFGAMEENQRCILRNDRLLLEVKVRSSAGEQLFVERWEVREVRGYVKASTSVTWRAGSPSGVPEASKERFECWTATAQERSYSEAVGTMLSDSIFGMDVPVGRENRRRVGLGPYRAPIPPSRVDVAALAPEPPLAAGERTTVEKLPFVKSSTLVTGDGQFTSTDQPESDAKPSSDQAFSVLDRVEETPYDDVVETAPLRLGAQTPPWHAFGDQATEDTAQEDNRRWPNKRRSPGEFYEVEFSEPVLGLLQFGELPRNYGTAVVEGRDSRAALCAVTSTPPPSVGSALISVNAVRVAGLSFAAAMALVDHADIPVSIGFLEAQPDALADSLGFLLEEEGAQETNVPDVERALASKEAAKLRDQLDEFVASFQKCDLKKLMHSTDKNKRPGPMFWSAVDFAARFLRDKRLLENVDSPHQKLALLGEPSQREDGADYWKEVRRHLERRIMARISDAAMAVAPTKLQDAELSAHLARLRFLKLADLGVTAKDAKKPLDDSTEWVVAQLELSEVPQAKTASEALERLASSVRFVASAVEASSNRGKPLAAYSAIGADELLPAITWTVIQANPPNLATTLWLVEQYAHDDQLRSEMGYAFANVSAAVNFARSTLTDASPLEGLISKEDFDKGVKTAHLTHKAADAALRNDPRQLRLLLAAGATATGLSVDQTTTPLVAAIDSRNKDSIQATLETVQEEVGGHVDARIRKGPNQGQTALMVAAALGDVDTVVALLKCGSDPTLVDARGRSAARLAVDNGHAPCAEALEAGDPLVDPITGENPLTRACACGDAAKTRGLLLRGGDPDAVCGKLGCPPLVAAAAAGDLASLEALLPRIRDIDACAKSGAFAGQTALMRCVGLDIEAARTHNLGLGFGAQNAGIVQRVRTFLVNTATLGAFADKTPSDAPSDQAVQASRGAQEASGDVQVAAAADLLARGASRTRLDASGRSALRWAESAGGHSRLVAVLRNDPARDMIYDKSRDRRTADVVALLEQGVDPDMAEPDKGYTALVAAAYNDDVDISRLLVDPPLDPLHPPTKRRWRAADVNLRGRGGLSPLMYAAQKRSQSLVTFLLRHGADREARDDRGRTALDHAEASQRATDGSDAATREQLRELLSVDPRKLLLVEAAARDDAAKVAALIAQGASPNEGRRIHSADGWHLELCTPLIAACAYDSRRAATALLDAPGIRVDLANPNGLTPLMYAAHRGSSTMLLSLLRAGADRRRVDRRGRTAHDWAQRRAQVDAQDRARRASSWTRPAANSSGVVDRADKLAVPLLKFDPVKHTVQQLSADGEVDGVVALVKQGVDVNALDRGQEHESALLACCAARRLDVLNKLLTHPAIQIDLANSRGVTPLMQAAASGFDLGVLTLLKRNANRYSRTAQGRTPADYASEHGHLSLAAVLQADPARVSVFDLAADGQLLLIEGLLRQRPDLLNAQRDADLATPLLLAAKNKRLKAVELLLKQPDINVDLANNRRETPLMHAAKAGALDICSRLLAKGASSRARDIDGKNPTSWATQRSYSNMMLYLSLLSIS